MAFFTANLKTPIEELCSIKKKKYLFLKALERIKLLFNRFNFHFYSPNSSMTLLKEEDRQDTFSSIYSIRPLSTNTKAIKNTLKANYFNEEIKEEINLMLDHDHGLLSLPFFMYRTFNLRAARFFGNCFQLGSRHRKASWEVQREHTPSLVWMNCSDLIKSVKSYTIFG